MRRGLILLIPTVFLLVVFCQLVIPRTAQEDGVTEGVIGPHWSIQVYYLSEGRLQQVTSTVPSLLVGIAPSRLKELCPYWQVKTLGADSITVEVDLDAVLDSYAQQRFIGIWGDTVTIFAGIPNVRQIPLEFTSVHIQDLPDYEVANLAQGIPFDSTEQKLQLLESLQEYRRVR